MLPLIWSSLVSYVYSADVDWTFCRSAESSRGRNHALLQIYKPSQYKNGLRGRGSKGAHIGQLVSSIATSHTSHSKASLSRTLPKLPKEEEASVSPLPSPRLQLVHITKTGGTALEKWGQDHGYSWGHDWFMNNLSFNGREGSNPYSLKVLKEYGTWIADAWHTPPRYFKKSPYENIEKFTVVRDPYARVISEFRCPWRGYFAVNPKSNFSREMRLSLRAAATTEDLNVWVVGKLHNGAARPPFATGHLVPQYLYIYGKGGDRVIKKENVLRLENITHEFAALRKRYDITEAPLEHINDSDMKMFTVSDLSKAARKIIEEEYSEDFERLGYPKL